MASTVLYLYSGQFLQFEFAIQILVERSAFERAEIESGLQETLKLKIITYEVNLQFIELDHKVAPWQAWVCTQTLVLVAASDITNHEVSKSL